MQSFVMYMKHMKPFGMLCAAVLAGATLTACGPSRPGGHYGQPQVRYYIIKEKPVSVALPPAKPNYAKPQPPPKQNYAPQLPIKPNNKPGPPRVTGNKPQPPQNNGTQLGKPGFKTS